MIDDAKDVPIIDLFSPSRHYVVPQYQRSFSWTSEEVETFWEDIIETRQDEREGYFLGAIILKEEEKNRFQIIDGQQRMVLITILFACIRDQYYKGNFKLGDLARAARIQSDYIGRRDDHKNKTEYFLEINNIDNAYFRNYIQAYSSSENKKPDRSLPESNKLIKKAYEIIEERILDELKKLESNKRKDFLAELEHIVGRQFVVIEIKVKDEADAHLVFETLNDRGLELSIADLLKNYLYSKSKEKLDLVKQEWDEIRSIIVEFRILNNFLRHYWSSSVDLVREKRLYKTFKKNLKTSQEVYDFVGNLKEEASLYKNLVTPTDEFWRNKEQVRMLEDLAILGIKTVYPLLLSGYIKLKSKKEFKTLVDLCLKLSFRYNTICSLNPNELEREYSRLAVGLRSNQMNLSKISQTLRMMNQKTDRFTQDFAQKEIKNGKIARYILREMINFSSKGKGKVAELRVEDDSEKVNLEHIMPQSQEKWKNYIKEHKIDHQNLINRIGNLTLLTGPKNKELSDSPFYIKCKKYKESKIQLTDISKYKDWNEESISERQEELTRIAENVWKI